MLFWVFGSSAAGKTTLVTGLRGRVASLEVHDFDEVGVPRYPTVHWRHEANELWLTQALGLEAAGMDLLVAGQTPIGELLAAPSAPRVDAISACLLDCSDEVRAQRITARGEQWLDRAGGTMADYLAWGEWMRQHARDPTYRLDVIRSGEQCWGRLASWRANNPRWNVRVIDTEAALDRVLRASELWVAEERGRVAAGQRREWFEPGVQPGAAP